MSSMIAGAEDVPACKTSRLRRQCAALHAAHAWYLPRAPHPDLSDPGRHNIKLCLVSSRKGDSGLTVKDAACKTADGRFAREGAREMHLEPAGGAPEAAAS